MIVRLFNSRRRSADMHETAACTIVVGGGVLYAVAPTQATRFPLSCIRGSSYNHIASQSWNSLHEFGKLLPRGRDTAGKCRS